MVIVINNAADAWLMGCWVPLAKRRYLAVSPRVMDKAPEIDAVKIMVQRNGRDVRENRNVRSWRGRSMHGVNKGYPPTVSLRSSKH
jgi:hypothetical protein